MLRECRPNIVLADHSGGLKTTFQFLTDVRAILPECQSVLWVSELSELDCFRALQLGARGVVKKANPIGSLVECLRTVHAGEVWMEGSLAGRESEEGERRSGVRLTPREREIVQRVCEGMKNKEIGEALSITPGTVKVHLMHIFEKTGVKDRFELAVHGRRLLNGDNGSSRWSYQQQPKPIAPNPPSQEYSAGVAELE